MAARVFVTVGTTQFDDLVQMVTSRNILEVLRSTGYGHMTIQVGHGTYTPDDAKHRLSEMDISWYRYKPSIKEDIESADLVISHAGAGSCLEVLHARKPLVVVVNERLMDNHQLELAEQMALLGHLVWTKVGGLQDTLATFKPLALKPYQPGDPRVFATFLDRALDIA